MPNSRFAICSALVTLAMAALPTPAVAQTDIFSIPPGPKRVDLSGSSGFLLSTDWSDLVLLGSVSTVSGAFEQVLVRDLVVDPGPVFDAVVTYWEGRYGFRVRGGFSRSCLAVGRTCGDLTALVGASDSVRVNTYMYDIGGAVGLMDYRRDAWAWPYFFLGAGGVTYDIERTIGPPLTFIERRPAPRPDPVVIVSRRDPDQLLIAIDELGVETRFALNFGVGADFRIPVGPASLGLRFEVADHLHRSPVDIRVAEVDAFGAARGETRLSFGIVHNLRAAAGFVVQFGR